MRDVSGSMGEFEKYISRSFYFWMVKFLRKKYNESRSSSSPIIPKPGGGAQLLLHTGGEWGHEEVSSAYRLALDVIREHNPAGLEYLSVPLLRWR